MKEILFLEYPKCSTCQKAKAWLTAHDVVFADRHIKDQNPTAQELTRWLEGSPVPLKKLWNTSGLAYRSLNLKEKLPTMTQEEQLALLATDGMLVKRPLIVIDGTLVLAGFKEPIWEEALL